MKDDAECFTNGGRYESFVLFRPVPPAKKSARALNLTFEQAFLFFS